MKPNDYLGSLGVHYSSTHPCISLSPHLREKSYYLYFNSKPSDINTYIIWLDEDLLQLTVAEFLSYWSLGLITIHYEDSIELFIEYLRELINETK